MLLEKIDQCSSCHKRFESQIELDTQTCSQCGNSDIQGFQILNNPSEMWILIGAMSRFIDHINFRYELVAFDKEEAIKLIKLANTATK